MATIYNRLLLAKTEITKGTDAVPVVGTDAVRVKSFKIKKNTTILERKVQKQTMGSLPHQIGKETVSIEIQFEMRGQGAAGTAPEASPLYQASRLAETIVASTSVSYKPSTAVASEKSCTIYAYDDGLLWKFVGAVGTLKIDSSIDGVVSASGTFQSAYAVPTPVSDPAGAVYDSTQPLVMTSASVFNDGAVIKVGKFGLDIGNDVQNHYVTGENSFVVKDRNPTMTFSKDSVNTVAEWTALTAGTDMSFSATFGATPGNILTITAPSARRKDVVLGERAERILKDLTLGLYESTSDDQFTIAFT